MAKKKQPSLYRFLQSLLFGEIVAAATIGLIVIWSLALIFGSNSQPQKATPPKPHLSVEHIKPVPQPVKVAVEPVQPPQPALETWQGPIQPLPENPAQPSLPILIQIPTTEPVVFLGIDDGWVQKPEILAWLTEHRLPFTLFLTNNGIKNNYNYYKELQAAGMTIENHTLSHPDMTKLTLDQQKTEICGTSDAYETEFGYRPLLFRPPYGKANALTLQAAQACGIRAVIMWHALVDKGTVQYQDKNTQLQSGDIVLLHFTNNFLTDIQAFMKQIDKQNLQVGHLEDWVY